ncbi:hypothetical protein GCM10007147_04260 [Nocardiopsis kunsanensis]|uniref:Metalloprotease n=1 Tax=Nocardiopsis kunsanensis TaxID=141693 RepID=A0A918X827_9ACTN|nr:neutral zinc metallopeptidase [Nocardiopsis kunsanensis]GHD16310.1 hypothetical protein GCM10007147_04260 [Nocardiopsis kunsanensis]
MENRPGPDHRHPPFHIPPASYSDPGAQGPYLPPRMGEAQEPVPQQPAFPPPVQGWDQQPRSGPSPGPDTSFSSGQHPQAPPGHGPPHPPGKKPHGVLVGASTAGAVALTALAASVLMVLTEPDEDPVPAPGTDLSAHYDDGLLARPAPMEVDPAEHPLYDVPMPAAVNCDLPSLDPSSDPSWLKFSTEAGECLDTVWAPVMDELGLHPEAVEFEVSTESPDADSDEGSTLAFYEIDHTRVTVVLPNVRELGRTVPGPDQEMVWLALLGHEYGHHVQYATGILPVSHDLRRNAEDEAEELDTLRRTELQAECMAGAALGGITEVGAADLQTVNEHFNSGGDLETHGRATNRAFWLEQGWSQETVAGCNTYDAEQRRVN